MTPAFPRRPGALPSARVPALAGLVCALLLSGCASPRESGAEPAKEKEKPAAADRPKTASKFSTASQETLATVRNQDLRLARWTQAGKAVAVPAATPITLKLGDGGRIAGKGPVNRYFGAVQLAVDGSGRLTWPNAAFGMSRMAGPPEAMALESKFVQSLASTTRLLAGESGLRFENADASTVLEFTR